MRRSGIMGMVLVLVFLLFLALQTLIQSAWYLEETVQMLRSQGHTRAEQLEIRLENAVQAITLLRRAAGGRSWNDRQLLGLVSGHPMFEHLHLVNTEGRVITTSDPAFRNTDLSSSAYFKAGLTSPKSYPLAPVIGQSRIALMVSSPWFFGSEETGLVLGELRLNNLIPPETPSHGFPVRQLIFAGNTEEPLWSTGYTDNLPKTISGIRPHLETILMRQTVRGLHQGVIGYPSVCYGFYHEKSGLVFWTETDVNWASFLGIQKNIFTVMAFLILGAITAFAVSQDRAHRRRQMYRVEQLIDDISNRKAIQNYPDLEEDDLQHIVRALERLHREHFLTHGPVIDNETYFERLIEHSADFIMLLNFTGQIRYVSKSLTRTFRIQEHDLINRNLTEFLPISREKWFTIVNDLMRGSSVSQYRTSVSFNNVNVILESRLSFIPSSTDSEPMIVINARDITQQEQLAEALSNREKLATLSKFSSGVVHDFSNLLMNIMGYLALAQMKIEKGESQVLEEIRHSQNEILRARELLLSLMAVSQGGVYQYEGINIAKLIKDVWSHFAPTSSVNFHIEGETHLSVLTDGSKTASIIGELFNNAVFFMGGSGVLVAKISSERRRRPVTATGEETWVKVSIIDSGPGIPEEISRRVFDPYVSTRGEGRGLGLAMVYSVMEAMGGWVEVQSRPSLGTSVNLYFKPAPEPPR